MGELRIEEMRHRFMNLKQEGRSVPVYNTEFVSLSCYAPEIRAHAKRYRRHYINRLRARIAGVVDNPTIQDIQELMNNAAQLEAHHKREREEQQARNVQPKAERGQSSREEKRKGSVTKEYDGPHPEQTCYVCWQACFNCRRIDHWWRECPHPPREGPFGGGGSRLFEGRGGGGPPQNGGCGYGRSAGRTRGQVYGRDGSRLGVGGGGCIGVHAVELAYEELGRHEGKEEVPPCTTSTELLTS